MQKQSLTAPEKLDLAQLAREHIDSENAHDLDRTMNTIGPDGAEYKIYPTGETFSSRDQIREFYGQTYTAFPDMQVAIRNIFVDDASRQVFAEYTFKATFQNPIWGLAPTGRPFSYDGVIVYAFDGSGKLTKEVTYFDKTELLASMGIIRDPNSLLGKILLIFPQSPFYFIKSVLVNLFHKS
jgi:steroid delta-isomerase-like uncharacterized protein